MFLNCPGFWGVWLVLLKTADWVLSASYLRGTQLPKSAMRVGRNPMLDN